jgi:hypothetical protein
VCTPRNRSISSGDLSPGSAGVGQNAHVQRSSVMVWKMMRISSKRSQKFPSLNWITGNRKTPSSLVGSMRRVRSFPPSRTSVSVHPGLRAMPATV